MSGTHAANYEPGVLRVLQTKEELKSFYNKIAGAYDLLSERSEEPMRKEGLKKLGAGRDEHILEIGCGTGHCLVELAQSVGAEGRVYGIDISEKMVDVTRQLLARQVARPCGPEMLGRRAIAI